MLLHKYDFDNLTTSEQRSGWDHFQKYYFAIFVSLNGEVSEHSFKVR